MRVALVCPYDLGTPGGVQDQVVRLRDWISTLGHEATILGAGVEGPEGAVLLGPVTRITANAASTPIVLAPGVRRLVTEVLEGSDVVHVHEPLMPLISFQATRTTSLASVGTFHADPPEWARRGYRTLGAAVRRIIRPLDVVTAVSPVAASALPSGIAVEIIPNGIDVQSYHTTPKVRHRVAFLGRDDPRKGLSVLLDAWPAIRSAIPDAVVTIMGAERQQAIDGVEFLGRVDEHSKRSRLAEAEVFVAPNLGGESFGIIVAEAMASRCAVVASAIPAFEHVLGGTGALFEPGNGASLARQVVDLLRDEARRTRLAAAALDASGRFDGAVVAARYAATYRTALSLHDARSHGRER